MSPQLTPEIPREAASSLLPPLSQLSSLRQTPNAVFSLLPTLTASPPSLAHHTSHLFVCRHPALSMYPDPKECQLGHHPSTHSRTFSLHNLPWRWLYWFFTHRGLLGPRWNTGFPPWTLMLWGTSACGIQGERKRALKAQCGTRRLKGCVGESEEERGKGEMSSHTEEVACVRRQGTWEG